MMLGRYIVGVKRRSRWLPWIFLGALGCGSDEPHAPHAPEEVVWFEDVTAAAGVKLDHVYAVEQRFWMPEISSGGLAFLDYDSDGALDLYFVQSGGLAVEEVGGFPNRLLRNGGDGRFEEVPQAAGADDEGYGHGCAAGDIDGDGDVDLFVANVRADSLYRNDDARFVDVTVEGGVEGDGWSTSSAFLDVESDGDLDLYVTKNLRWDPRRELPCASFRGTPDYCGPLVYDSPSTDRLFLNDGRGRFRDVSEAAGILAKSGIGLGVAPADYDGDGDIDIYVANDSVPNHLWVNDGKGRFREEALRRGCAVSGSGLAEAGMGVHAADPDVDGDWDLFMTHIHNETNTYYRNQGGVFSDRTSITGLAHSSVGMTGWGIGFHDYDQDGEIDVFIANGRVEIHQPLPDGDDPYAERNQLFRGAGGLFTEVQGGLPAAHLGATRAATFGDYDSDGDVDIAYLNRGGAVRLLRNVVPKQGDWIGLRLLNASGAYALGAEVRVSVGERTYLRQCQPAYSYCSSNDPAVVIGLGETAAVDEVVVRWVGGVEELFGALEPGRYHDLRRGAGSER